MKLNSLTTLALIACLATGPALWAGGLLAGGLLDRDAQRLQRARETHSTEIDKAFEAYATRVDRANATLTRIYEPLIDRYASRGDGATSDQLKGELADLLDRSLKMPFPDDDDGSDGPPEAHRQLINAIGPQLVNARQQRAPATRIAEYDYVVLYYTAGWCAPCRAFTPELIQFYHDNRGRGKWEVIVVSGDRSERDFYDYLQSANMPWAAVPYERIAPSNLPQTYPGGYPRLVVLDREGKQAVSAGNRVAILSAFRELLQR